MVNFENGTLVKKAYVEIDGVQYEVHMPEVDGATPLSAELLNKMQEDLLGQKTRVDILNKSENGTTITLPINYKVGTDVLDVYLNGERLLKASTSDGEGHYYEVGEVDSISNQIKITDDWNLDAGDVIEIVVRGEYTDDTE